MHFLVLAGVKVLEHVARCRDIQVFHHLVPLECGQQFLLLREQNVRHHLRERDGLKNAGNVTGAVELAFGLCFALIVELHYFLAGNTPAAE